MGAKRRSSLLHFDSNQNAFIHYQKSISVWSQIFLNLLVPKNKILHLAVLPSYIIYEAKLLFEMPSENQLRNWRHISLVQTEWKQQPLFISSHRNPKHLRRKHQTRGYMRFHLQKLSPILDPFYINTTTCNKRSLQRSLSKVFTCYYKVLACNTKTGDFIFSDYG